VPPVHIPALPATLLARGLTQDVSPDRVSALSRPGTRPGIRPVIRDDRLEEAAHHARFPAAFRLPAFASRSSDSRRGVGPSLRSAYRVGRSCPDLDRVTAFRTRELRPGWVPSLPRGRRCSSRTEPRAQPAPAASQRPVLYPRSNIPSCEGALHGASTRVQAIHPSGHSPRLRPPGWNGPPLGLSPELRTPPTKSRRRTSRWGQAIEHGPGTTRSTSHRVDPPIV